MRLILLAVFMLIDLVAWSADGDTFIAQTIEGVEVTYEIISERNGTCQVGFTYNAEQGIKTAIDKSISGTITIPEVVNGFIVSSISDYAFNKCNQLTSVFLPKSINSIGKYAFAGCNNILSLILPNSVKSLGNGCFENCYNLQTLNIPDSVETIGKFCFNHCSSWASIVIPNSVKSIGNQAFDYCSKADTIISLIEVPFSITDWVFHSSQGHKLLIVPYGTKQLYQNCNGWKNYFEAIEEASQTFSFIIESEGNGCVTYGSITIKNKSQTFTVEEGTSATLSITPDTGYRIASVKVNGTDVTSSVVNNQYTISNISSDTSVEVVFGILEFELNGLNYRAIPNTENVKVISKTSTYTGAIVIPESASYQGKSYCVKIIEDDAFNSCKDITSVSFPNTLSDVYEGAFFHCI